VFSYTVHATNGHTGDDGLRRE